MSFPLFADQPLPRLASRLPHSPTFHPPGKIGRWCIETPPIVPLNWSISCSPLQDSAAGPSRSFVMLFKKKKSLSHKAAYDATDGAYQFEGESNCMISFEVGSRQRRATGWVTDERLPQSQPSSLFPSFSFLTTPCTAIHLSLPPPVVYIICRCGFPSVFRWISAELVL